MKKDEFEKRIAQATTKDDLTTLMNDLFDELYEADDGDPEVPEQVQAVIDKGFDIDHMVDGETGLTSLEYAYCDDGLKAARIIFETCGLPKRLYDDDDDWGYPNYLQHLRSKLDHNYFNNDYLVKLYLLACSFYEGEEPTHLHFSENLCAEMLDPAKEYFMWEEPFVPLRLTAKVFREIEKFDFMVEMEEPKLHCSGCWKIHIFDKATKIEVATYY